MSYLSPKFFPTYILATNLHTNFSMTGIEATIATTTCKLHAISI